MPVLDDLIAQQSSAENEQLRQASADNNWAQVFNSYPPTEKLRASRNLNQLMETAANRKLKLLSQTNEAASRVYLSHKKFEQEERLMPLREGLLQAQIEAQGATARFNQQQDLESTEHVRGLANWLSRPDAPKPGTAGYPAHVAQGIDQFPRAALTKWGQEFLPKAVMEHKEIDDFRKAIPEGYILGGGTINKEGEVSYQFRKPTIEDTLAQPALEQFDTEEAALKAGRKVGDIIMVRDPETKKYRKARID